MYLKPLEAARMSIETMMRKFPAVDLPPKDRFHYHQGVFLSGVYENYLLTGDEDWFEYMRAWCDSHISPDGSISGFDSSQLDDVQPGILLYPLLKRTGDSRYKTALDTLTDTVMRFPKNQEGGLWHKERYPQQMWLDGLYMAGPIVAEYAKTFDRPEYFDFVAGQALMMGNKTRDESTGLMYHAWDHDRVQEWADPVTGRSPEFWGRSMGWVGVAILNDLDFFPADHPKRRELEKETTDLLCALLPYQGADGRWYQVTNRPDDERNWPENSCTCLYAAAICKSVRLGLMDGSCLEKARKAYEGVIRSLKQDGKDLLIGDVCIGTGVGNLEHYLNRPTSVNDLHGVGAFLIMCAECARAGI
ncbi:MAG: glycoside hydrolase family 88 protein [Clostridia bacterium]|nr:glycoside hydrolase family 88 protein [Clostridia bacterium]